MASTILEAGVSKKANNIHRALASLQEEFEAIDYYHQRADVSDDETLKAILIHNRDDEMEHAMMLMEWLRRAMPAFDVQMKKFLFTTGDIIALTATTDVPGDRRSDLGLGNLK